MPVGVDAGYASVIQLCTSGKPALMPKAMSISSVAGVPSPNSTKAKLPVAAPCQISPAMSSTPEATW